MNPLEELERVLTDTFSMVIPALPEHLRPAIAAIVLRVMASPEIANFLISADVEGQVLDQIEDMVATIKERDWT